ncbi:hypothetical protein AUC68_00025 [Methyloceanibacter methanicus]|uniref:Uncharacterized protein n=1 Tax=Methyloceanibacter methanicus TaxID=1774968 RepID=A0A1E3W685_9HYPH|nr:DUF6111 family protein [Methyloceanibacter methanicus]ODS01304.1 hypothetical protein AUC68_00025 [Methyloceanibacter methanicus]
MLRVILINILLFLLPFLVYAAYVVWVKGVAPNRAMAGAPFLWLVIAGLVVLFVGLFTLVDFTGGDREGRYQPSVLEDGVIKPGGIN